MVKKVYLNYGAATPTYPVVRPWLRGSALGRQSTAGGISTAVTGFLADRFGLLGSLEFLVFLPSIAAIFCLGLPRRENE